MITPAAPANRVPLLTYVCGARSVRSLADRRWRLTIARPAVDGRPVPTTGCAECATSQLAVCTAAFGLMRGSSSRKRHLWAPPRDQRSQVQSSRRDGAVMSAAATAGCPDSSRRKNVPTRYALAARRPVRRALRLARWPLRQRPPCPPDGRRCVDSAADALTQERCAGDSPHTIV